MWWIALIVSVLGLASVKVDNELEMTKAYNRQAAALEKIVELLQKPIETVPCQAIVRDDGVLYWECVGASRRPVMAAGAGR